MKLKVTFFILITVFAATFVARATPVAISAFGSTYTQNFDTLASTGTTNTALPDGWAIHESGTSTAADQAYAAGTGSLNAGNIYSFGASASTDRALGSLQSGTLIPLFGVQFENLTGGTINTLTISYTGEQWRFGAQMNSDRLDFQYSLDATGLTDGTWIDVDSLDFSSQYTGLPGSPTSGALNGNAYHETRTDSINALSIAAGATFWLRWTDYNANGTGADDGLAVDDFWMQANGQISRSVPDSLPAGFVSLTLISFLALGYRYRHQLSKA